MNITEFELGEKVFEDAVGNYYFAKNKESGRTYYIKVLDKEYASQNDLVQAFHKGAETACSLENLDNAIRALGHGDENEQHYLILDLESCDLYSFGDLLLQKYILSIDEAISFIEKLATILRNAHLVGIVHGNLTPQNIFVDKKLQSIKISDFGFGELVQLLVQKKQPKLLNSLPYYAPESINNQQLLACQSDIYSLGVLFYRALVGNLPWNDYTHEDFLDLVNQTSIMPPSLQRLEIPDVLDNIVLQTLESKTENRCPNLTLFLQNLTQAKSLIYRGQTSSPSLAQGKQSLKQYSPIEQQKLSNIKSKSPPRKQKNKSLLILFSILALIVFFISFITNFNKSGSKKYPDNSSYEDIPSLNESDTSPENMGNLNKQETSRKPNELKSSSSSEESLNQQKMSNKVDQIESLDNSAKTMPYSKELGTLDEFHNINQLSAVKLKVSVKSGQTPLQAEIYIDGNLFGRTNNSGQITVSEIQLGKPYIFRVQKNGFEMWAKEITYSKPGFESLDVQLQALPAYNPVTSNQINSNLNVGTVTILQSNPRRVERALVYINGQLWQGPQNSLPLRIELPAGEYKVEVKKDGFKSEPISHNFRINRSENKTLYFYLIPE